MVKVAKSAGFCFGVRRAVGIAVENAGKGVYSLGPIIHNKHVVADLNARGLRVANSTDEIPEGAVAIIRSHGVGKKIYDELTEKNVKIIDATCPYVARLHEYAHKATAENRTVIVIGDKKHPEVLGIVGWAGDRCEVFSDVNELSAWLEDGKNRQKPLTMVAQTTLNMDIWEKCSEFTKKVCTNAELFDTICKATEIRQIEAAELSASSDAMIVIGDKSSSNTSRLVEICRENCSFVLHIEDEGGLSEFAFPNCRNIGITAGASTPDRIIKEVEKHMTEEIKNEVATPVEGEKELSFEEMLEQSFKTLNTGDKVTGVVTAISPTEISVELGTKQSGFIPVSELTDDPTVKVEDLVHIGDEIETYVIRVNDIEGIVTLSKKRLDTIKSWEDVEQACREKTVVEGVITEENKGGVVASVRGVRVFIPASQTGIPKDQPLTELLRKKVKLRITEFNRYRRRVVGTLRVVTAEERREQLAKVWETLAVGNEYKGTVKSLTSYGVFVDIGGVDGMVHVSELSWNRVGNPADVVKVGDELDVRIIALDNEKHKISLSCKKESENPWNKFTAQYKVDDTVSVKIAKMMPFGAFAEIIPGVDGLIHISQISDRRIARPSEVLSDGQQVDVRITDIDYENKKISLSIKALLNNDKASEEIAEDEVVATSEDKE